MAQGSADAEDYGRHESRRDALQRVVSLYDAWHAAEPDKGHDAKAAEWRAKLAEWQDSTQPADED